MRTTSAPVAAKTSVSAVAPVPRVRMVSRSTVTRSARCPSAIRPASSKPSERCPSYVAAASSSRADQCPRFWVASRSCISTARISSNRSITAWLSEPSVRVAPELRNRRAGPMPSARSRSVVGQKQTLVRLCPSRRMSPSVRWVACTARGQRAERAGLGEQLGRGHAGRVEAGLVLRDLLGQVHVQRLALRRLDDDRDLGARHGADRVDGHPDPRVVERRDPLGPLVRVAVGVAHLHPLGLHGRTRRRGSRCRAAGSGCRPRRRRRAAPCPSRWGRRTASRRAGGAGSGTPRPR